VGKECDFIDGLGWPAPNESTEKYSNSEMGAVRLDCASPFRISASRRLRKHGDVPTPWNPEHGDSIWIRSTPMGNQDRRAGFRSLADGSREDRCKDLVGSIGSHGRGYRDESKGPGDG